mmetsp:Transcript_59632/g.134933  ORF Transcript_59632/g.134933 Transcript_59632/m.134933 type:complete len:274 (-) Transcript_59632:156-977(-)
MVLGDTSADFASLCEPSSSRRRFGLRRRPPRRPPRSPRVLRFRSLHPNRDELAQRLRGLREGRRHARTARPSPRDSKRVAEPERGGDGRHCGPRRRPSRRATAHFDRRLADVLGRAYLRVQRGGLHWGTLSTGPHWPRRFLDWLPRSGGPVCVALLWIRGRLRNLLPLLDARPFRALPRGVGCFHRWGTCDCNHRREQFARQKNRRQSGQAHDGCALRGHLRPNRVHGSRRRRICLTSRRGDAGKGSVCFALVDFSLALSSSGCFKGARYLAS